MRAASRRVTRPVCLCAPAEDKRVSRLVPSDCAGAEKGLAGTVRLSLSSRPRYKVELCAVSFRSIRSRCGLCPASQTAGLREGSGCCGGPRSELRAVTPCPLPGSPVPLARSPRRHLWFCSELNPQPADGREGARGAPAGAVQGGGWLGLHREPSVRGGAGHPPGLSLRSWPLAAGGPRPPVAGAAGTGSPLGDQWD